MNDVLTCPICGRDMEYKLTPRFDLGKSFIRENIKYSCESGHEKISVVLYDDVNWDIVLLGDGVYLVNTLDNSSCERAISRMKLEYDCEKFIGNFV
jgi:hypothetical protein